MLVASADRVTWRPGTAERCYPGCGVSTLEVTCMSSHQPGACPGNREVAAIRCRWPPGHRLMGLDYAVSRTRASGGIGRRAGFRFLCPKGCGGSSPPSPTLRWARVHFDAAAATSCRTPGSCAPAVLAQSGRGDPWSGAGRPTYDAAPPTVGPGRGEVCYPTDISRARVGSPGTVPAVPTDLGQLHRRQAAVARLARIGAPAGGARAPGPMALEAVRRTATPRVMLPAGAAVRSADDKGRVKPGFSFPLIELLGWVEGDLACHAEGPWLVLTQPPVLRGRRRTRNSTCAHLSCSAAERTCFSPAQAHAMLGAGRQVLLVPVPDAGALVVCDPGAFLAGAPPSVARLFEQPQPAALSLVAAPGPDLQSSQAVQPPTTTEGSQ